MFLDKNQQRAARKQKELIKMRRAANIRYVKLDRPSCYLIIHQSIGYGYVWKQDKSWSWELLDRFKCQLTGHPAEDGNTYANLGYRHKTRADAADRIIGVGE